MSVYIPDPALNDWVPLWNLGNNVPAVQPAARVYHSVAQSIPNGVATILNFDSERFDTDNMHDTVTNNDRLTCRTPGKYVVGAGVHFSGAGGNYRQLILLVNGMMYAMDRRPPLGGGIGLQSHLNTTVDLRAGDYVQVQYGHDIGSASSTIIGGNYSPEFWMALIGGMQGPPGPGTLTYGTTFPVNPTDGQEHVLVDSLTASTYQWRFRYNANAPSVYKWEFIGGPPIVTMGGSVVCTTTAVVAMSGAPTTTVPRTGLYNEELSAAMQNNGVASGGYTAYARAVHSISGNVDLGLAISQSAWSAVTAYYARPALGLVAGETIIWQAYLNASISTTVSNGRITLTPIRVS